ncbi:13283_t:CDS:2, partial [Acaulospora colombiana]
RPLSPIPELLLDVYLCGEHPPSMSRAMFRNPSTSFSSARCCPRQSPSHFPIADDEVVGDKESKPFGTSNFTTTLDVNAGLQPNTQNAPTPSTLNDETPDEPPCSGKQASQPSIAVTPQLSPPINTRKDDAVADSEASSYSQEKPRELGGSPTDTSKKLRFKVPLALPRLSKKSRLRALFTPTKPVGPAPNYARSFINIFKFSPLNILLAFIPVSWALHFTHQSDTLIFATSALSVLPLAALLGFGTEQVAIRTSSAVAGLLNASLGNLTELIIAGICLTRCQLGLVQSSLLGGLLSNLLLVLGMAFVVGGFKYPQLSFRPAAAQLNASLLTHTFLGNYFPDTTVEGPILLQMSHGFSVILMFIHLFLDMDSDSDSDSQHGTWGGSSSSSDSGSSSSASSFITSPSRRSSTARTNATAVSELAPKPRMALIDEEAAVMPIHPLAAISSIGTITTDTSTETIHYPLVNMPSALILLAAITATMYLTAENLVDSLTGLTDKNPNGISKEFLSLIVLPVLSNGAELSTAIYAGYKGKFDLVLGVAVGSCIQITLFVIPMLVCVAWGMGKPLSLLFDPLETTVSYHEIVQRSRCALLENPFIIKIVVHSESWSHKEEGKGKIELHQWKDHL